MSISDNLIAAEIVVNDGLEEWSEKGERYTSLPYYCGDEVLLLKAAVKTKEREIILTFCCENTSGVNNEEVNIELKSFCDYIKSRRAKHDEEEEI